MTLIRDRMDAAYTDKLDGRITEEFWQRKMVDWQMEEQQAKMALDGLASAETSDRTLDAERTFELANRVYFSLHEPRFDREGQSARNDVFELLRGCRKCNTCAEKALRCDLPKSQNERMVGARGFEPPTPCSRSRCATRLRYAPTM